MFIMLYLFISERWVLVISIFFGESDFLVKIRVWIIMLFKKLKLFVWRFKILGLIGREK